MKLAIMSSKPTSKFKGSVSFEQKENHLFFEIKGVFSFKNCHKALLLIKNKCDEYAEKKALIHLIMSNTMDTELAFDLYRILNELGIDKNYKIACFDTDEITSRGNGFAETALDLRGHRNIRFFKSKRLASNWLISKRSE